MFNSINNITNNFITLLYQIIEVMKRVILLSVALIAFNLCYSQYSKSYKVEKQVHYENYAAMGCLVAGFGVNESLGNSPKFQEMTHKEQYNTRACVFVTSAIVSVATCYIPKLVRKKKFNLKFR